MNYGKTCSKCKVFRSPTSFGGSSMKCMDCQKSSAPSSVEVTPLKQIGPNKAFGMPVAIPEPYRGSRRRLYLAARSILRNNPGMALPITLEENDLPGTDNRWRLFLYKYSIKDVLIRRVRNRLYLVLCDTVD